MLDVDIRFPELEKVRHELERFAEKAVPFAVKDGLNVTATATQTLWQDEISRMFTHRDSGRWLERSIWVDRARGNIVRDMRATVGALADRAPLMGKEELGGTISGKSGRQAIAAPTAAGQAAGGVRTRRVMGSRKMSGIKIARITGGNSRKQRNAVAMAWAKRHGQKFALLERPSGGKGLFLLGGGKRRMTARLLFDVSKQSVRIQPHPALQNALRRVERIIPDIFLTSLISQCRRWKIAGY